MNINVQRTYTKIIKTLDVPEGHLFTVHNEKNGQVYLKIKDSFILIGTNGDTAVCGLIYQDRHYEHCSVEWMSETPINIKLI